jgi:hypothetical protein
MVDDYGPGLRTDDEARVQTDREINPAAEDKGLAEDNPQEEKTDHNWQDCYRMADAGGAQREILKARERMITSQIYVGG